MGGLKVRNGVTNPLDKGDYLILKIPEKTDFTQMNLLGPVRGTKFQSSNRCN